MIVKAEKILQLNNFNSLRENVSKQSVKSN